jgi:hypothetical protein
MTSILSPENSTQGPTFVHPPLRTTQIEKQVLSLLQVNDCMPPRKSPKGMKEELILFVEENHEVRGSGQ